MMADAFSMFDYGGNFLDSSILTWMLIFLLVCSIFSMGGMWVCSTYYDLIMNKVLEEISNMIGLKGRAIFGLSLLCSSLFLYLSLVSLVGIFPYSFCLTAHFSHNLSISLVLWFSLVFMNLSFSLKGFLLSFVPGGLPSVMSMVISLFEIISFLSRSVTLGARLTMNMIAGKLILCIGSSFLGSLLMSNCLSMASAAVMIFMVILASWEMVVGLVQAYIFTFLLAQYVNEISL